MKNNTTFMYTSWSMSLNVSNVFTFCGLSLSTSGVTDVKWRRVSSSVSKRRSNDNVYYIYIGT